MTTSPCRRPRLLVLTSTFPRWEADTQPSFVLDLCLNLRAAFDVTVLAPHAPGARYNERMDGIDVWRFRYGPDRWESLTYGAGIVANLRRNPFLVLMLPLFFAAQLRALLRLLREYDPETVHAHWLIPQGIVLAAALALPSDGRRPRAVCTAHGSDVSALRGWLWRRLRRWIVRGLDKTVAVSPALRDDLIREGCPLDKIGSVSMGVNLQVFHPAAPPRTAAALLYVGRLVHGKGVDVLIGAMPTVLAARPDATLTIVGDGIERMQLDQLAIRLRVRGCVHFVGTLGHADLAEQYQRAALLVVPSRAEGFGLVMIEAMSCGCPVVASDLPSIRSVVADNETGCLFRMGDSEHLAKVVLDLLADNHQRANLAERAQAIVRDRFAWPVIGSQYAAVLQPSPAGRV